MTALPFAPRTSIPDVDEGIALARQFSTESRIPVAVCADAPNSKVP